MSWSLVECGFGHWSSYAPHSQRFGADSTLVNWYPTINLILISKCHKCHSLIFQIRSISWVPIIIAQWYPRDLSIPYLASVHHDYEVSRFITVPLTTLSSLDNPEFIGYVCQLMKNAWSTVIESDIRGVQWRHHTYTSRSTVSSDEDEVKISAKMRHTYEGRDVVSLWMS